MTDVPTKLAELRQWRETGTLKDALATQRLGAELSAVEDLLRKGNADLVRLDHLKALAEQSDLSRRTDRARVAREAGRIKACGTDLERAATPEALRGWQRHRWKDVPDAGRALEAEFQTAWSSWCDETFGEPRRLARVLERLEPTKDLGKRMLGAAEAGLALRHAYPPGKAERDAFARAEEACRRCRDELSGTGGASGVAELLLKAADGTATLADVSPELSQWLIGHQVQGAFRLTLA